MVEVFGARDLIQSNSSNNMAASLDCDEVDWEALFPAQTSLYAIVMDTLQSEWSTIAAFFHSIFNFVLLVAIGRWGANTRLPMQSTVLPRAVPYSSTTTARAAMVSS